MAGGKGPDILALFAVGQAELYVVETMLDSEWFGMEQFLEEYYAEHQGGLQRRHEGQLTAREAAAKELKTEIMTGIEGRAERLKPIAKKLCKDVDRRVDVMRGQHERETRLAREKLEELSAQLRNLHEQHVVQARGHTPPRCPPSPRPPPPLRPFCSCARARVRTALMPGVCVRVRVRVCAF